MTKHDFFNQKGKRFFIDDLKRCSEYVKENCQEEADGIIKTADDVVNKKFLFQLRWDMERTHIPEVFENEINWLHMPAGDPEWIFQFNRHRFWICLGQAYALTRNEKYAKAFVSQMIHWIKNVRLEDPMNGQAWRTIEAGLRLEYWLKAFCYFEESPELTDEVCDIFQKSIIEHAEYLMGIYDTFRLVSNWGVLQNHGLFVAGVMLPETRRTLEYRNEAIRRLEEEIRIQVYGDGVHWEQSPMYHNEVTHDYLDVKILADRNNIELPKIINENLHKMCYASMYHKKPNHFELLMGDSDEIDVRDIISKGAYIYKDSVLKFGGYKELDFDCIWDLGFNAAEEYLKLESVSPDKTAIELKESGNYYLHSDWSEKQNFFHFHCGTLGAGHGHSDKLHIDLFSNGEDILVDAGRYTYVNGPKRYEFKDPSAHNTITVDGKDFIVCKDSWECSKLARGINQKMVASEEYDYLEGGNLGYYDLDTGSVYVNRRILYIKPDIYIIVDEFYGNSFHKYNQYFHFNNNGNVAIEEDGKVTYKSDKNIVEMCFASKGVTKEIVSSKYSKHYNEFEENKAVKTSLGEEGFASIITVISTNPSGKEESISVEKVSVRSNFKNIIFEDNLIEAITITKGERRYTAVFAHQDYASPTDSFNANDCIGFGQVVVFNNSKGEKRIGKVLLW